VIDLLNAFGRAKTTFAFAAGITVATWGLGVPFILWFGIVGFGVVNLLIQLVALIMFHLAKQNVRFGILRVAVRPWGIAVVIAGAVWLFSAAFPPDQLALVLLYFVVPLLLYAGCMALIYPRQMSRVWALARGAT
jgi:O-antigen/teichoic acid export membrane protein